MREHLTSTGTFVLTAFKAGGTINDPAFGTEKKRWEKPDPQTSGTVTKLVRGKLVDPGLTHHNSEAGLHGKFHIPIKPRLLPYSLATFR